ncbi:MAG: hypothetical protein DWQ47_13265 [Acidobacteria bacterium]|nr:MAG: hypothetical protein DWQ32_00665 [Acidobacteriota bacterium]REK02952.1 MAG: hypothetical protein DWQ38_11470 [Acidobacteriota bacterium]REK13244.1 MAG: hypothetical protein DWQ43_06355 [Acidobacteriota bacterium]REK41238.1 MAG: hypothetical protein DWQ47_13265 [Acidobacteriota bacterium]
MKRDYFDLQERTEPLAYLITFRCYGTWLHGDKRGSVDRKRYNRYGAPDIPECKLKESSSRAMGQAPFVLGHQERRIAEEVIREVSEHRGYGMFALSIRTNHIHVVVAASHSPERVMNDFKAYITRRFRKLGLASAKRKVWSRHGSTKYLWTEDAIEKAVDYVLNGLGGDFKEF